MADTTEPMTVEQAADSLLAPETPAQEEPPIEAEAEEVDVADDAEEPDGDAVEDEAEADDEAEAETDEEDAEISDEDGEDETDETDDDEQEQPEAYTVTVDGQEVTVTLDELKRSYSGQKYIQKGMQEAAEAKKQVEAALGDLHQKSAYLDQILQQTQQEGILQQPKPPSKDLFDSDPLGYMEAKVQYDEQLAAYQQQQTQIQQWQQQRQALESQARQQFVAQQMEVLTQAIPDFADEAKGAKLKEKIVKTGRDYGLTDDELGQIIDARHVQILHDAMKWRDLQASKPQVANKAKQAKPKVKAAAKKAADPKRKQRDQAKQRLKQTGSLQDAASLILDM